MNTKHKLLLLGCFVLVLALSFVIGASNASAGINCNEGTCFYTVCDSDADCGGNGFYGIQTCRNNSVYQNYKTNTCVNPGTQNAYCISSSEAQLQKVCNNNQTCSYGACVGKTPTNTQTPAPSPGPVYYTPEPAPSNQPASYIKHYRTNCYASSIYWYDSRENVQDLYQNCTDSNACTVDSCGDNACKNTLRCDGSTCAINSADYMTYCANTANQGQNQGTQINIQIPPVQVQNMSIAITGKKESDSKWEKEFSIANDDKINFLVTVKNISSSPIDNVLVRVDGDSVIAYDQDIKIDNIPSGGNMVSGINLGMVPAGISKEIAFSGLIKPETIQGSVKVTSTVQYQNISNTDSLMVNLLGQVKNNFAAALGSSAFMTFFKKWWLWILATIVLVVLFFVIYRRISSDV